MSIDNRLSIFARLKPLSIGLLTLTACLAMALFVSVDPAYAADDGLNGHYTVLETASANNWRVFAKRGETIVFTLHNGIHYDDPAGGGVNRCVYIYIANSAGTRLSNMGYTCDSSDNVINGDTTVTLDVTASVVSMSSAYRAVLQPAVGSNTNNNGDVQGYEWNIWVRNTDTRVAVGGGRVWFDGDTGLRTWQYNPERALTSNVATFNFTYVRLDGYRYRVKYKDYHGIWSKFHGGIYGVNTSAGDPAYVSIKEGQPGFQDYDTLLGANKAYVYVDCGDNLDLSCPSEVPSGIASPDPNPISAPGAGGFRFTGSATSLAGQQVIIPYTNMQSGYIRMSIYRNTVNSTVGATLVCQRQFLIDNPNPTVTANLTWTWPNTTDSQCTGTLSSSALTLNNGDYLIFQADAFHRGEMHFLSVDAEKRGGGIDVIGATSVSGSNNTSIIWYDPFSRLAADTCGNIPARVGAGLTGPVANGSNTTNGDNNTTISDTNLTWISTSSFIGSVNNANAINRQFVNSAGGVHGWDSASACDGSGDGSTDGYANDDGTASAESTWGNNRVIEDWTYDGNVSQVFSFSIGGPTYTLSPSITASPSTIVPSQTATFTPGVTHSGDTISGIYWELARIVVDPGASINLSAYSASGTANACDRYTGAGINCTPAGASPSGGSTFPGYTFAGINDTATSGLTVGSRLCYTLLVSPYNQNGDNYSQVISCVTVAAGPYVSVIGGAVWSGGSVTLPYINDQGKIEALSTIAFGSFGEYDVSATSTINYFGSAARPGTISTAGGAVDGAGLTFGSATSLGSFSNSHKITNLLASLCNNALANNTSNFAGAHDEVIALGDHEILCLTTLNIKKNITYQVAPVGMMSFGQLPSLIVVAREIYISGDVNEIAGSYYVTDKFVTCSEGPQSVSDNSVPGRVSRITTSGSCTNKLTINGSVTVANQAVNSLVLNRSYGGTREGEPAEVIRMRPEVFLTPFENSLLLTTVHETELPARY